MQEEIGKFLREMMFLCEPWEVVSVDKELRVEGRTLGHLTIHLEIPEGQPLSCPKCGRSCHRHDHRQRTWRHWDFMEWRTTLSAEVPRVHCPEHGVREVDLPVAERQPGPPDVAPSVVAGPRLT